ncbi:MAG: hypothetical protein QM808_00670 [Steroidobacteraceae bacterium]
MPDTLKPNIHGGGKLEVHGSLSSRQIVVILTRDNFQLDAALVAHLVDFLVDRQLTVVRYDSEWVVTKQRINPPGLQKLPRWLALPIKALILFAHPRRWRHFSRRYHNNGDSIAYRLRSLRELIQFLGPDKELVLVTRSASGRVASLLADEAQIKKLICLGYPFKHPDAGPEPARYQHLETLHTPLLIIQGTQDVYGGAEIKHKYKFAQNTTIQMIDADHNFSVSETEWHRILELIDGFIRAA